MMGRLVKCTVQCHIWNLRDMNRKSDEAFNNVRMSQVISNEYTETFLTKKTYR